MRKGALYLNDNDSQKGHNSFISSFLSGRVAYLYFMNTLIINETQDLSAISNIDIENIICSKDAIWVLGRWKQLILHDHEWCMILGKCVVYCLLTWICFSQHGVSKLEYTALKTGSVIKTSWLRIGQIALGIESKLKHCPFQKRTRYSSSSTKKFFCARRGYVEVIYSVLIVFILGAWLENAK